MQATRQTTPLASAEAEAVRLNRVLAPQLLVVAAILLDVSLPDKLTLGPSWMLPAVEGLLLIGLITTALHVGISSELRRKIAIGLTGLVSAVNAWSLVLLCHYLLRGGKSSGRSLIYAGIVLWVTNVLLFALWFWQIDRGGPMKRALDADERPDFMFVQMSDGRPFVPPDWKPSLTDYLYLSFTNATAFSPTDTMPLTATAKWLMTAQSLTALVTVVLVVSRAVNILS